MEVRRKPSIVVFSRPCPMRIKMDRGLLTASNLFQIPSTLSNNKPFGLDCYTSRRLHLPGNAFYPLPRSVSWSSTQYAFPSRLSRARGKIFAHRQRKYQYQHKKLTTNLDSPQHPAQELERDRVSVCLLTSPKSFVRFVSARS